jgi:hypothetical protein
MNSFFIRTTIALGSCFAVSLAIAGDFKGNGGGAIQCPGQALEILDFYEARELNLGQVQLGTGRGESDLAQVYLSRLKVHSPVLAQKFQQMYQQFETEAVFLESVPIENIDDLGVQIPANCQWRQIVNQNPILLPPGKKYLIDRNAWAELVPLQKVGLIFHELFYLQSKSETSKGLRLINGLISVDSLNSLPLSRRLRLWIDAGLSWMETQGLTFQLDADVVLEAEVLLQAKAVAGSDFHWKGLGYVLYPRIFTFHSNGNPKSFCFSNQPALRIYSQEVLLDCWEFSSLMVEFYENGQIKNAHVRTPYHGVSGPNFSVSFSDVSFGPDGTIEALKDSSGHVQIDDHIYKIHSRQNILFHPNGQIKLFNWGFDESQINPEPFPYFLWDQVIYPKNQYPLTFDSNGKLLNFVAGKDGRIRTPQGQWISFRQDQVVHLGGQ